MGSVLRVHEETLPNGLRVVVTPRSALHRVAVGLWVGVGARHETQETNGLTHFLEHMLYRGTRKHPSAHLQNRAIEELGGNLWAATHGDHTLVSVTTPPVSVAGALELLGELITAPRFSEIELERRIVREEILENVDEHGRDIDADNVARMVVFGDHPLGFTITGPAKALDRFDSRALRTHMRKFYGARNSLLSIAGACDAKEILRLVRKHLGRIPPGERRAAVPFVPTQKAPRRRHVASPGSQTDLRVSFLTPGDRDSMAPGIELLMRTIDDGMSTRLYHRLADAGGLVYDCSASWEPFSECGAIDFAAEVQHARLPQVLSEILTITRELREHGPTRAELVKAKNRHRWNVEASIDDAESLCGLVGGATFFGRPRELEAQASRYDRLGPHDVAEVARAIFRPERMSLVTIGSLHGTPSAKVAKMVKSYTAA